MGIDNVLSDLMVKAYTHAISIDSKYIAAYYNRDNAYSKIAEDKLALKDLTKAIELDKKFYQAYYNRGSAYNRLGESRLAKNDLEKAKVLA